MDHFHGDSDDFFKKTFKGLFDGMRDFGEKMREMGPEFKEFWTKEGCCGAHGTGADWQRYGWNGYPPANIYKDPSGSISLEFALAGFPQDSAKIAFQGDYLILSAAYPQDEGKDGREYVRHGFWPRSIEKQKYYVPAEEYDQEKAKAVFKNGVLVVTVPPKGFPADAVKIEIVKEGP